MATTSQKEQASSNNQVTKAWSEQAEAWQQQLQEYQRSALEHLAKGQELYAEALRTFAESSKRPDWSPNWSQVAQAVDAAYDFTAELLNRQRAFTKNLLETTAKTSAS